MVSCSKKWGLLFKKMVIESFGINTKGKSTPRVNTGQLS